jgi:hypothetical protein
MASPWSMPQHDVDQNSPSGLNGDNSFDSSQSRQRRGSSPGKRALQWFTRNRSASPQIGAEPSSPNSLVVRNVTKQPGGVSQGQYAEEYHQVRSQPLAASLGVPPGGPGGGVGYGTAKSSNDGRPENHIQERGRSMSPTRPTRPPSPGAITAGAFRSGRVSPGPQSWTQAHIEKEQMIRIPSKDRQTSSPKRPGQGTSPSGPRSSPFTQQQIPQSTSPLAGSVLAPSVSTVSVNANERSNRFSVPVHFRPSSGPPPIIPLEGLPSPIDIPISPAFARDSPLGSVSPGGSPAKVVPGSPNVASRWMKGLFGKSPRQEEQVEGMYSASASSESQWMKPGTSPLAPASSKHLHNAWTDGSPLAGSTKRDEEEAEEKKRQSMRMAAQIEDEHRQQVIKTRSAEAGKEYMPRQAVQANDSQEWDPPQSKSPPGRKPVPRYSAQELQSMSQQELEDVASLVDPDDRLSKLEGRLTPAQQIIAETRSRQATNEQGQGAKTQVQRGFDATPIVPGKSPNGSLQRKQDDAETPVRRDSKKRSPVKAETAATAAKATRSSGSVSQTPAKGRGAGNRPPPHKMTMSEAMQDMMTRFYRFERYALPLMRSMEARIIDVERDNQMALHGDAMSANSARDREMDKWVGQMTGLMKHEIGQLRAATLELYEGREQLADCVKMLSQARSGEGVRKRSDSPSSTQVELGRGNNGEAAHMKAKDVGDHNRTTNISSASFNSAVPRQLALDIPGKKTNTGVAREVSASNSSPNGRMRYTSVLGQPMQGGKISPAVSPSKEKEASFVAPSPTPSAARRMQSLDDRLKALVVDKLRSPSITGASTHASSQSIHEEGDDSDNTSFEKIPSQKIGDDYQVVMARGQSEASARSAASGASSPSWGRIIDSQHLQTPSATSAKTDGTIKRPAHQNSRSSSGDDGRNKYLTSPSSTPSRRQQSSSPTPVTTSVLANNNLRARAQSYLLNADGSSSVGSSTQSSPSPSPRIMDSPPIFVKPLQPQRGNYNDASDLLGSNAPTLKVSSNTPVRPSIRDRVAFFDAAR